MSQTNSFSKSSLLCRKDTPAKRFWHKHFFYILLLVSLLSACSWYSPNHFYSAESLIVSGNQNTIFLTTPQSNIVLTQIRPFLENYLTFNGFKLTQNKKQAQYIATYTFDTQNWQQQRLVPTYDYYPHFYHPRYFHRRHFYHDPFYYDYRFRGYQTVIDNLHAKIFKLQISRAKNGETVSDLSFIGTLAEDNTLFAHYLEQALVNYPALQTPRTEFYCSPNQSPYCIETK